jgi:hypothetical protein
VILKEDDFISAFTDPIKDNCSSEVLIALVHIAQVRPAAVKLAEVNWALAVVNATSINNIRNDRFIIFF